MRRFLECTAFAALAACVGTGMRTRTGNPALRVPLREDPIASAVPIEPVPDVPGSSSDSWLVPAPRKADAAPADAAARHASTPSPRADVSDHDAAQRIDLVARVAARAGWSRDDRRRDAVASWFDGWSAARDRLRDADVSQGVAMHRRFAADQEVLRDQLSRDFETDDAAEIARLVPLFAWDEASGSLRRVGADGKPFPPEEEIEMATTVASK